MIIAVSSVVHCREFAMIRNRLVVIVGSATALLTGVLIATMLPGCRTQNGTNATAVPGEPPWFEDVTAKVGLNFTHDCGPTAPPYFLPQITGSGGAAFDFDGDGRIDFYLIHNGGPKGK